MMVIRIASDFSRTPAGRTEADHGTFSGETFRKEHLVPKLREAIGKEDKLVVLLDGTAGYPASFLDEAFGGLVRVDKFNKEEILTHLEIKAESSVYAIYEQLCLRYIKEA